MLNKYIKYISLISARVGFLYFIIFLLIIFCVDLKLVKSRNEVRRLNGSLPNFTTMVNFALSNKHLTHIDWNPYKDYFELVLKYIPEQFVAKNLLGYVYYQIGQEDKAVALFKSTEKYNHVLFWPNYNLGLIYFKRGEYQQAYDYLTKAVSSNPELIRAYMLDEILYKQIFSISTFDRNLQDQINDAISSAYVLIIASLGHLKSYDRMLVVSNIAMRNKTLHYQEAFSFYAALASLELKQLDKTLFYFDQSLKLDNKNPLTYFYLSQIYKTIGREDVSQKMVNIYSDLHLNNKDWLIYDQRFDLRIF